MTEPESLERNLRRLSDYVAKMQRPVERAQALLQVWLTITGELNRRFGDCPPEEITRACVAMNAALDAVSWVTRKIIDPIVNEILETIGLQKLVDKLERSVNPLARTMAPVQHAVVA